jgi:hypothetical protein
MTTLFLPRSCAKLTSLLYATGHEHFSGSAVKCNIVSMVCSSASGAQSIEQGALEICSGIRDAHDLSQRVFCIFIFSQAEAMDCLGTKATFLNIWGLLEALCHLTFVHCVYRRRICTKSK